MNKIQIKSSNPKTYAVIIPEIGAILAELVIDGCSIITCPVFDDDYLRGKPSAFLFPFPNRLEDGKYTFEGHEYQMPITEPARQNAIHGFVYEQSFEIKTQTESSVNLIYQYDGRREYYPFSFDFEIEYKFINNCLSVIYSAKNTGSGNMPCGFGWHPYFEFGGESIEKMTLELAATRAIQTDDRMIARGFSEVIPARTIYLEDNSLDNGFKVESDAETIKTALVFGNKRIVVEQQNNTVPPLNYLMIYTPNTRKSVAIEPMTCNINALNNGDGLTILSPNQQISGTMKIYFEETH
jgi:aldose 1-epimerase